MMRADFGNESADVIKQDLSSGAPALAPANLPEGGWVSNLKVQGQSLCVVRDPTKLRKGREALSAIQQKWQGLRALEKVAKKSANIQNAGVTAHPLVGRQILVAQPKDTTYPEPPSVLLQPAVVYYHNPLVLASRERAYRYVGSVKDELEAVGKDFRTFTAALKAHQDGELNTRGLRDLMVQLMAEHPQLLQDFETFLPLPSSPSPMASPKSNGATGNEEEGKNLDHEGERNNELQSMFVVDLSQDKEATGGGGGSISVASLTVVKEEEVSTRVLQS